MRPAIMQYIIQIDTSRVSTNVAVKWLDEKAFKYTKFHWEWDTAVHPELQEGRNVFIVEIEALLSYCLLQDLACTEWGRDFCFLKNQITYLEKNLYLF